MYDVATDTTPLKLDAVTLTLPSAAGPAPVYSPEPMPDDTSTYGVYNDDNAYAGAPGQQHATADQAAQLEPFAYSGYDQRQYGYDPAQQHNSPYSVTDIGSQT